MMIEPIAWLDVSELGDVGCDDWHQ